MAGKVACPLFFLDTSWSIHYPNFMPRIARGQIGGTDVHVINRGNGRMAVFHCDDDYHAFIELIGRACQRTPMRVFGCCLMPNHFHLICRPAGDDDLSKWMQWLMTSHVRRHHRRYDTSGHLWQGRYKSFPIQERQPTASQRAAGTIQTGDPVLQVLRYVERNPLRADLVARAEMWRWSSLHWWLRPQAAPHWWDPAPIERPDGWANTVNLPESDEELAAIQRSVQRGRPYGADEWVARMANEWGLESTLRSPGRPKREKGTGYFSD